MAAGIYQACGALKLKAQARVEKTFEFKRLDREKKQRAEARCR